MSSLNKLRFHCPKCGNDLQYDTHTDKGWVRITCDKCTLYVELSWDAGKIEYLYLRNSMFECPICHTNQPPCNAYIEFSENYDYYNATICMNEECSALLDLSWNDGCYISVDRAYVPQEIRCPICESDFEFEIEYDYMEERENGEELITCPECASELYLSWYDWKIQDVWIP